MPPPPPPPGPGPPRGLRAPTPKAPAKGGGTDRNDLLASIQMGKALKKTTTNDRSAPIVDSKAKNTSNGGGGISGGGGGGGYGGGGGGGSGGAMMNGGAPQLGGLFAGGMPKLRSTGRGIGGSSEGRSAPILPPGGRNFGSHLHGQRDNSVEPSQENRVAPPASPKPSSKASPAPPPPPATRKPSHLHDRRGPLPEPPNPASKPAPPRPPQDISPSSPRGNNPPLPSKPPALVNKPSVGNKPAPPRPPNTAKPAPPPARPMSNGRPAQRSTSFRERGSRDFSDISSETSLSAEGNPNLLTSAQARTLPVPLNKTNQLSQSQQQLHGSGVAQTVGRQSGIRMLNRSQTRPPSERPRPARPPGPAPPPPIQPPPPPPHRNVPPPPSSKPEPPPVPVGPPPPPPARVTSHSQTPRQTEDFESKFKNKFNLRNEFPLPKQYENCTKTYPSRNAKPSSQRRAPPPPPGGPPVSNQSSLHSPSPHYPTHTGPPPPPPHAPLHLQVGPKMYSTEASHC